MKITTLILLVCITGHFNSNAQFSQGAKDSAQNEILQLTSEWNKAIIKRDSLTLDKILSPEYSLNGSVNRGVWINNTLNHFTTDSLEVLGKLNIVFYGQAARSEGMFFWKASFDGKPRINGEYSVTDIWTKSNGHWRVILRMSLPSK